MRRGSPANARAESRDYYSEMTDGVRTARLNSPWRVPSQAGLTRDVHQRANQSGLSDVLKLSDKLLGTPSLVKKTASAAQEFRRLQVTKDVFYVFEYLAPS
jgi:hypothetical protein